MRFVLATVFAASAAAQGLWVTASPPTHPPARYEHAMVYDDATSRALVFGGLDSTSFTALTNAELWAFDGGNWQLQSIGPFNASRARAAVSTYAGSVLIHGGYYNPTAVVFTGFVLGDTWRYQAGAWSQVSTAGPAARHRHQMVETPQGVLLFGGIGPSSTPIYGDTWRWNGTAWTQLAPATSPSARVDHSMVYDSARGVVVLFGGMGQFVSPFTNDTWEFDGTDWQQRTSVDNPPAQVPAAMAYSPATQRTVLLTGNGETWTWDGSAWQQPAIPAGPAVSASAMAFAPGGGAVLFGGFANNAVSSNTSMFLESPSTLTPFGAGCPGPGGAVPTLAGAPGASPALGTTMQFRVGNLPGGLSVPVLVLGLSNTRNTSPVYPLPIDLGFVGFPGCTQLVSIDAMMADAALTTEQDFPLVIPLQTSLLGFTLHGQAIVLYLGGELAVSNAVTVIVGV